MAEEANDSVVTLPPIIRSSEGLRDALIDEIDRLRAGITTPTRANALARLAEDVLRTIELELLVNKMAAADGDVDIIRKFARPISLGRSEQ